MPHALCLLPFAAIAAVAPAQLAWQQHQVPGSPPARTKHRIAHNQFTGSTLLFGGIGTRGSFAETWRWDGSSWTQLSPANSPPARWQHAMTYDIFRQRAVVFSGWNGSSAYYDDTWEWDGSDWIDVQPATRPPVRDHHAMVFDPVARKTFLFGGWNYLMGQTLFNDMWQWDGQDWSQMKTLGRPPARDGHEMCYDFARGNTVLFGGGRGLSSQPVLGDTWTFDSTTRRWRQRKVGTRPPARYNHRMAYDQVRHVVVMFGGNNRTRRFNDVWEWDGVDWRQRPTPSPPTPRQYAEMFFDTRAQTMFVYGGDDGSSGGTGSVPDFLELAPAFPASHAPYGAGCAGTAGTPALTPELPALTGLGQLMPYPWVGTTYGLHVRNVPPIAPVVLMLGGSNQQFGVLPLPVDLGALGMAGCALHQSADVAVPGVAIAGVATIGLPIPRQRRLLGNTLYLQAFVVDPGANGFGATVSDAAAIRIGGR